MGSRAAVATPVALPPQAVYDPFEDPGGWTATPKCRRQYLRGKVMGEGQMWLIEYLAEVLWGNRKKIEPTEPGRKAKLEPPLEWTPPLTFQRLGEECGVSGRMMQDIVEDGVRRGLLARARMPRTRSWIYKLLPQNWATAPPYDPLWNLPEESADGLELEPAKGDAPEVVEQLSLDPEMFPPLLLRIGEPSEAQPLFSPVMNVKYTSDHPVTVLSGITNGALLVSIRGEEQAKHGSPLPSQPKRGAEKKALDAEQFALMRGMLDRLFRGTLGPVDDAVVYECLRSLGTGEIADAARKLVTRTRHKRPGTVTWGLVILIVADTGKLAAKYPRPTVEAPPPPPPLTPEERERVRRWENPTPEERAEDEATLAIEHLLARHEGECTHAKKAALETRWSNQSHAECEARAVAKLAKRHARELRQLEETHAEALSRMRTSSK